MVVGGGQPTARIDGEMSCARPRAIHAVDSAGISEKHKKSRAQTKTEGEVRRMSRIVNGEPQALTVWTGELNERRGDTELCVVP